MTTRYKGGLGNKNRICLQLDQGYAQITGNGAERDVSGRHVFSPCKVQVECARAYGVVGGSSPTSEVKLYAGSSKSGTLVGTAALSDSVTDILMTLSNPGKVWPADQEFCLSEKTSSSDTIDYADVTVACREYEA